MKKIICPIVFIFFLCSFNILSSRDDPWERIIPTPQEHDLYCVQLIPNSNRIVAAGRGATIMYSEDDGESWELQLNPANLRNNTHFIALAFYNEMIGFAVTLDGKIIRTINGGQTWELTYYDEDYVPDPLYSYYVHIPGDIHFIDEQTIIIIGFKRQIMKSTDGGIQWNLQLSPVGFTPHRMDFINQDTGFIVGFADSLCTLKSIDAGDNWTLEDIDHAGWYLCNDIKFLNEEIGFISSTENNQGNPINTVFKTKNSGETWDKVYASQVGFELGNIEFKNDSIGAIILSSWWNSFLHTDDGGETWIHDQEQFFNYYHLCHSFFFNSEYMFGVGDKGKIGKLTSIDNEWLSLSTIWYYDRFGNALFTSPQIGYVIAYNSNGVYDGFYKTIDFGKTWHHVEVGDPYGRSDISFINDNNGYILFFENFDDDVLLMKTEDGGLSWSILYNFGYIDLDWDLRPTISFHDSNHGLVAVANRLYKTTNGGTSWDISFHLSDESNSIVDLDYVSRDTIFLCAYYTSNSIVYRSIDGGYNFEEITVSNLNRQADKVYFKNNLDGFLLSNRHYAEYEKDSGLIFRTQDGGNTWHEVVIQDTSVLSFENICFTNNETGYLVGNGDFNTFFKTSDEGETWIPYETNCNSRLTHLVFFDDWHGLIFGDNGVILETFSGGVVGLEENPFVANKAKLSVYPNPAKNKITIQLEEPLTNDIYLELYNLQGKCLARKYYPYLSLNENISLDISDLPPGLYTCSVKSGNSIRASKVVKL